MITETLENEGFLLLEKLLGIPLGANDCEEVVSERGLDLKEELEMGFLFKGYTISSILKQIRLKMGGLSKKQQKMKNIRKKINFEIIEKELTESFKGIMDDNEAKEAIMRVIYGRLDRDNEDREEKNMGVFFERLAQKSKMHWIHLNSRFLAINQPKIRNFKWRTLIIRKVWAIRCSIRL